MSAKPIPRPLIEYVTQHSDAPLLTVEDGAIFGGFGQALLATLPMHAGKWELAGYADHFIGHGTPSGLEQQEGLSNAGIVERVRRLLMTRK